MEEHRSADDSELPDIYGTCIRAIRDTGDFREYGLEWPDARFDRFALDLFTHQFEHNEAYRAYCERRGTTPETAESYREIPAVATRVFKETDLTCGGPIRRTFRTSGTTVGTRGEHHFRSLVAYRASMHPTFRFFCNPEGQTLRMLVVAPPEEALPESSLSFMLSELVDRWGDEGSSFFAGGELNFDFEGFADALNRAEAEGVPTMVVGTAFGLASFFEAVEGEWTLPEGSRLMETGGFKGRQEEVSKRELYATFEGRLGLDGDACIGEYGMTELSSQAYTAEFSDHEVPRREDPARRPFFTPPWMRVDVVDATDLEVVDEVGVRGLLRWYDLANLGSVAVVQTSDVGYRCDDGGVVVEGRADGADLRGCSLTAEEMLSEG